MKRLLLAILLPAQIAVAAGASPVAVPDSMAERVKPCVACHGPEGRAGGDAYYPRLAGKPQGYLYNQLRNFRESRREYTPMALLLEHLSDPYLMEIAGYFAGLRLPYPSPQRATVPPAESELARKLVTLGDPVRKIPACVACHGKALMGAAPDIPGLLGLPRDYVSAQFGGWRIGLRRAEAPDCMAEISKQLTATEVSAVAAWLAAQPVPVGAGPASVLPDKLPLRCGSVAPHQGKP